MSGSTRTTFALTVTWASSPAWSPNS